MDNPRADLIRNLAPVENKVIEQGQSQLTKDQKQLIDNQSQLINSQWWLIETAREEANRLKLDLQQARADRDELKQTLTDLGAAREEANRLKLDLQQALVDRDEFEQTLTHLETAREETDRLQLDLQQARADKDQLTLTLADLKATRSTPDKHPRTLRQEDPSQNYWTSQFYNSLGVLTQLPISKGCSVSATELLGLFSSMHRFSSIHDVQEDYGQPNRWLVGFAEQGKPQGWGCFATLVEKGVYSSDLLDETGCSSRCSLYLYGKCLQVRAIEEDGEVVLDFRMA